MLRSTPTKVSTRSAAVLALGLIAAMLSVGAANAASAPVAAPAIHRSVRTVTKGAAVPFPTGQTVNPIQGIHNPEIPPEPESEDGDDAAARAVQRHRQVEHSLSHRPSAKMTAQLKAAEAAADLPSRPSPPSRWPGPTRAWTGPSRG